MHWGLHLTQNIKHFRWGYSFLQSHLYMCRWLKSGEITIIMGMLALLHSQSWSTLSAFKSILIHLIWSNDVCMKSLSWTACYLSKSGTYIILPFNLYMQWNIMDQILMEVERNIPKLEDPKREQRVISLKVISWNWAKFLQPRERVTITSF